MFHKKELPLIIIVLVGICLSCAKEEPGEGLAMIGDEVVTLEDIQTRLEGMPPFMQEQLATPEGRARLLKAVVEEEIIVREALERGLDKTDVFKDEMARRERDMLVRLFYERVIEAESQPSPSDVDAYYEANKAEFTIPESVRGRHILVETKSEAQRVRSQLEGGADFVGLAKEKSLDTYTKDRDGVFHGEILRGKPIKGLGEVPELVEVCFQLEPGQLSQPVKTEKGYHIVRIDQRTRETVKPLDQVRSDIVSKLVYDNRAAVRDSILGELMTRYDVVFISDDTSAALQTPEDLFKIASEESDPGLKIKHYRQFTEQFPDDERAYEAKFMIGFTMAEDLHDYDGAEQEFKEFLKQFPETDLSDDAKWMIENMRSGKQPEFGSE